MRHAVVPAYLPVVLLAENVVRVTSDPRHEGRPFLRGGMGKLLVERRKMDLLEAPVGRFHVGDPVERQLLDQPVLVRPEHPLGAPPCFRGIGRDHLDPHLIHGPSELGRALLVHLATLFGGIPIMASPVGVEGAEDPPLPVGPSPGGLS